MIKFIIGLIFGSMIGVLAMALVTAGTRYDDE